MDIQILERNEGDAGEGATELAVTLSEEDMRQLEEQAARALAIDLLLPPSARTPLAGMGIEAYTHAFIQARAVSDALESRGIVPVAPPRVASAGFAEGEPFTCEIRVVPRPDIGLTSLDPVDLTTQRIAKPGFSAQAAREGADDVEFVEDEKTLRMAMVNRLDSELPEAAIRALADEYKHTFEMELSRRNIDPESYQLAHGLNEEQYELMLARHALSEAHWDFALDAVFAECGLSLGDDDLLTAFELQCPGHAADLLELHELHGDLHLAVEKVRRGKALLWLKENALK